MVPMASCSGIAVLWWYYINLALGDCVPTLAFTHLGFMTIIGLDADFKSLSLLDVYFWMFLPHVFCFFFVFWPECPEVLATKGLLLLLLLFVCFVLACVASGVLGTNLASGVSNTSMAWGSLC